MAKISTYYQIVSPLTKSVEVSDNSQIGSGAFGSNSWYQGAVTGSARRLQRYKEFDNMDRDIEVSRSLDTIAEEMIGNINADNLPLQVEMMDDSLDTKDSSTVMTLKTALKYWCEVHSWRTRLYRISRHLVKYGDVFFRKTDNVDKPWMHIPVGDVQGAMVNPENLQEVTHWIVTHHSNQAQKTNDQQEGLIIPVENIVRFTLNDDMCESAPFGQSILQDVFQTFRQKQMLEDSVIIYRIRNAPERRVYYINTGKLPPPRAKMYLEQMKNELNQRRIPSLLSNGQDDTSMESTYNPMAMTEDIFISQSADGTGSKVEQLPGGAALGELTDLEYWQTKLWRGLRIPPSYLKGGDGQATYNDGKTGVAYILELRFCQFVKFMQSFVESPIDDEFKRYLRAKNINIDPTCYRIRLREPSNFGVYRQQELDSAMLSNYGTADGVNYLSKRFIMGRYLGLSDEDIALNDQLRREELGLSAVNRPGDLITIYNPNLNDDSGDEGEESSYTSGFDQAPSPTESDVPSLENPEPAAASDTPATAP